MIGYRLSSFNDCTEAARSLRKVRTLMYRLWMSDWADRKVALQAVQYLENASKEGREGGQTEVIKGHAALLNFQG